MNEIQFFHTATNDNTYKINVPNYRPDMEEYVDIPKIENKLSTDLKVLSVPDS